MPSLQNASYNSARVQRAYRINNIETLKLNNKIQLLEKERLHRQRLTNQDIRLISLTLDYIQTCSGHSAEGLAPEGENVEEVLREDNGPTFLYGERIVSRKKRRTIRPQSAMDKSSSRLNSESVSTISSIDINARPQSSPLRKKPSFVTQIRDDESVFGSSSESTKTGASTPTERFKPDWLDEPIPDVTKILLRAATENKGRESVFNRTTNPVTGSGVLKSLTRNLRISSAHSIAGMPETKSTQEQQPRPQTVERGTRITDILNRGPKATMSANAWKAHLNSTHAGPVSSSFQRQHVMDTKKYINNTRTEMIQGRVKKFIAESSQE
ncbi:hypothetical protein ACF0H5_008558 [Mactra antiquata]